jgi:hypothetical protein
MAVVKLTTVQVTKLPLRHKVRKKGMIYFVKPVLTEDLCIVQKKQISITSVRYVHLKKSRTYSKENAIF